MTDRPSRRLAALMCGAAALSPWLVIGLMSSGPFSNPIVPEIVEAPTTSAEAITIFTDMSETMAGMSIGLTIGAVWLFHQVVKKEAKGAQVVLLCLTMTMALISMYSGLRFRFDMAQQLRYVAFDFAPIAGRLFWQGAALTGQLSGLCASGVLLYLYGDQRFRLRRM